MKTLNRIKEIVKGFVDYAKKGYKELLISLGIVVGLAVVPVAVAYFGFVAYGLGLYLMVVKTILLELFIAIAYYVFLDRTLA